MSGLESKTKVEDFAQSKDEGVSDGVAEVYIDPAKEAKMMRKFDV